MKLAVSLASVAAVFAPAVALACPYSEGASSSSCGGSIAGYAAAVGIGLAVGVGSIFVERRIRGPKP